jgi:ABC-type cobalamin/Fe3+-siderophores transport system ATPase subunit
MDVQTEKLRLIAWLAELNDAKTILEFISLKNKTQQAWWNEIGDEERAEIEKGLAQADKEELVAHEVMMAKYKKWR